jgi:hypothetical protein
VGRIEMAYTILVRDARRYKFDDVGLRLYVALEASPFVVDVVDGGPSRSGHRVLLRTVRLRAPRPYCGQHPGPCEFPGRARRRSRCLEWGDWVAFNAIVNDVLDALGCDADAWSTPPDVSGKFWVRRGGRRRVRYDWTEEEHRGRVFRVWNRGTPDQFIREGG